jgi:hypothetical protein
MATTLKQAFNELKSRLELSESFQQKISQRHKAVRTWVEKCGYETKLIGSLQRKTRIAPRKDDIFDIDILVIMGDFTRVANPWEKGILPKDALDNLYEIILENERYAKMEPEKDYPTIVIEYSDNTKVEIVPAFRDYIDEPKGRGYWIPKTYNEWDIADYDYDANYISQKNQKCDGLLIPTIKILKAIKRAHFPQMKSYHLEVLATKIVSHTINLSLTIGAKIINYPCEKLTDDWCLLMDFFKKAQRDIFTKARLEGSKSPPADSYLTDEKKKKLSECFYRLHEIFYEINELYYKRRISDKIAIEIFREIFGEPFPTYG